MRELPKGWILVEFDELFNFVIGGDWGKDPKSFNDPDYAEAFCIRGSEIKNWTKEKGKTAAKRLIKNSSLEKRTLMIGDILVEISGGGPDQPVGRTLIIDQDVLAQEPDVPKVCTNFFRLVRLSNEVNKAFINQYLRQFYLSGEVINYQGGSNNLRNLKFKEYSKISIPLPPLAEQERIVEKLDALFASLDVIKDKLHRIPELLKNFRQQVLTQAVTGKLTEEWRDKAKEDGKEIGEWELTTIGDLFEVKTGSTPKRGSSKYYDNATIPWLKSGQVKNELIYQAEEFITDLAIKETNARVFPLDTLLVAMYGEGKTRGQVGWMKIEAATNQAIAALVNVELELVTRKYVYYFCLSQYNEIRKKAEGGNQPNLNLRKIKEWELDLPDIEEQQEIVRRVEELFAIADRVEAQYTTLKEKVDKLPQAILAKAFRGELVEQDPEDEPAEVLLERIKAESGKGEGKKVLTKGKKYKINQSDLSIAAEEGGEYGE